MTTVGQLLSSGGELGAAPAEERQPSSGYYYYSSDDEAGQEDSAARETDACSLAEEISSRTTVRRTTARRTAGPNSEGLPEDGCSSLRGEPAVAAPCAARAEAGAPSAGSTVGAGGFLPGVAATTPRGRGTGSAAAGPGAQAPAAADRKQDPSFLESAANAVMGWFAMK